MQQIQGMEMDSMLQLMHFNPVKLVLLPPLPQRPVCNGTNVAAETLPANQNCHITHPESITRGGDSVFDGRDDEMGTAETRFVTSNTTTCKTT